MSLFAPICLGCLVLSLCQPQMAVANDPSPSPTSVVDWMLLHRLAYRAENLVNGVQKLLKSADWLPVWALHKDDPEENKVMDRPKNLELLMNDIDFANSLAMWVLPESVKGRMSRFAICWFRMWFLNLSIYLGLGAVWCYYVYFCFGKQLFGEKNTPTLQDMRQQIFVAVSSMHWYAMKDAVATHLVELGWSKAYARIDDVGIPTYLGYFLANMVFVEFCVYWIHRLMHDIPWAMKHLHHDHHIYNKADSLSPFAGIAFHPFDGALQVLPYSVGLFIFPMHYLTHLVSLAAAMFWTHSLHDCVDLRQNAVLGSGYHTVHHTTYKDNYGQYTIYFDWLFGTLTAPEDLDDALHKVLPSEQSKVGAMVRIHSACQKKSKKKSPAKRKSSIRRRASKQKRSRRS